MTGGVTFSSLHESLLHMAFNNPAWNSLNSMANWIAHNWAFMERRSEWDPSWWGEYREASTAVPFPADATTYECDAKLGSPRPVDCSKLQYSEFKDNAEIISIEEGVSKFLHVDTCNVGISASTTLQFTYQQLIGAVNGLIERCVNNPLANAVGGRAYHEQQKAVDTGGRRRDATALNALPDGVNITLFQQLEASNKFPPPQDEMRTCTWQKVLQHEDVRACQD